MIKMNNPVVFPKFLFLFLMEFRYTILDHVSTRAIHIPDKF